MEEYLKTLLEQIRCKQARGMVKEEIRGHMEEQIAENLANGMDEKQAVAEAVKDMGDPVEVGISMDALHRPRISWSMIALVGIISVLSIVLQIFIITGNPEYGNSYILKHIIDILLGFGIMLVMYRLDYSILGKYGKWIAGAGTVLLFLGTTFLWIRVNGASNWIKIGYFHVSVSAVLCLSIPLYAGILYQYYGKGYAGAVKCILWMFPSLIFALKIPHLSLAAMLFFLQGILLSMAVCRGWIRVNKAGFLSLFWGVVFGIPVLFVTLGMKFQWFAQYQMDRLHAYLNFADNKDTMAYFLKTAFSESRWIGTSGRKEELYAGIYSSDYIFTFISVNFGVLAAVLAAMLILFVAVKILKIASSQKNELGRMVGYGCGLLFLTMTVLNVAVGTGLVPSVRCSLPFISSGGSSIIVSYAILGIVLSIYRYKDILPADRKNIPGRRVAQ